MMLSGHPRTQSLGGSEKSLGTRMLYGHPRTQSLGGSEKSLGTKLLSGHPSYPGSGGGTKRAWVRLCFLGTLVPSLWGLEKRAWVRWCFLGTLRTSWWNYGELSFLPLGITTKSIEELDVTRALSVAEASVNPKRFSSPSLLDDLPENFPGHEQNGDRENKVRAQVTRGCYGCSASYRGLMLVLYTTRSSSVANGVQFKYRLCIAL